MKWILIFAGLLGLLIAYLVYRKLRIITNFRVVYRRALRNTNNKNEALRSALEYLAWFERPFYGLEDRYIQFISRNFAILDDPASALQPILAQVEKEGSIQILRDRDRLIRYRDLALEATKSSKP